MASPFEDAEAEAELVSASLKNIDEYGVPGAGAALSFALVPSNEGPTLCVGVLLASPAARAEAAAAKLLPTPLADRSEPDHLLAESPLEAGVLVVAEGIDP
jgi:hypothetical protein